MGLLRRHPALPLGLFFAAGLLLAPVFAERGTLNDLWNMAFFVVLASAWNLLGGFAGQVSLGYSAFVGIGAYTTVLLANAGWSPALTLPVGAAIAVAFSVVVGLPTFRLRGPYFTIATIGVGEAVRVIASGLEFTGGSSGVRMPAAAFDFNANYYAMVALALVTLALVAWLQQHAFGLALEAIRQDIDAAEALGVHSTQAKLQAHAISAALVAVAGGLFATNFQYISPGSVFDFRLSLTIVLMPIVGGMGTLTGPVLGALLFSYLQIKLLASPTLRDSYLFIYGGLLIVVMLFEPKGIVGLWERLIGARPWRRTPAVGEARRAS
jgi:branched-chain amino acid transport system permease protein